MENKRFIIIYIAIIIAIAGIIGLREGWFKAKTDPNELRPDQNTQIINTFAECESAGFPVAESYPRQCLTPAGETFTEYIGNELDKKDLITIDSPRPNVSVSSPLEISGAARGNWFFEASFPVSLVDQSGKEIATAIATAQGEWMTENFVPYKATMTIPPTFYGPAQLILKKDNASGLPEHDDQLVVPIMVAQ